MDRYFGLSAGVLNEPGPTSFGFIFPPSLSMSSAGIGFVLEAALLQAFDLLSHSPFASLQALAHWSRDVASHENCHSSRESRPDGRGAAVATVQRE
jgi:hypothetical protein